jgi:hypothetical protein
MDIYRLGRLGDGMIDGIAEFDIIFGSENHKTIVVMCTAMGNAPFALQCAMLDDFIRVINSIICNLSTNDFSTIIQWIYPPPLFKKTKIDPLRYSNCKLTAPDIVLQIKFS